MHTGYQVEIFKLPSSNHLQVAFLAKETKADVNLAAVVLAVTVGI